MTRFYDVGRSPTGIAFGDFNGDGFTDLLAVNDLGEDISVLLNAGDGSFLPETRVGVGLRPRNGDAGDLNGDGFDDAVIANTLGNSVSILIADSGGILTEMIQIPVGAQPIQVDLGDIDNDGDLDIATANQVGGNVTLLINAGDGNFPESKSLPSGPTTTTVFFSDCDLDGDLDLLASSFGSHTLALFLGNGKGDFEQPRIYETASASTSAIMTDLTGDGMQDIVTTGGPVVPGGGSISIWTQLDSGEFSPPRNYYVAGSVGSLQSADLDLDGLADIIGRESDSNLVVSLWGDPTGHLSGWINLFPTDSPSPNDVIDGADLSIFLNVWGIPDSSYGQNADYVSDGVVNGKDLAFMLSNWGALKARERALASVGLFPLIVVDIDNDGDIDVAGIGGVNQVGVILNDTISTQFGASR